MKTMKKGFCLLLAGTLGILLWACVDTKDNKEAEYMNITAEEAKKIMDTESDYIILDVRTEEEFAQGHIPGAMLIPDYAIREKAETALPDKDALILVYCRSGRRSKNAAQILAELGYSNIREFGGIMSWPYETVAGE